MNRKKELKAQYLTMKKPMGTFIVKNINEKMCHIEATNDLKGTMNGTAFKLKFGGHPNRELQKAWKVEGEGTFKIEILEELKYAEDESVTDYSEELALQAMICQEKYEKQGYGFYKR